MPHMYRKLLVFLLACLSCVQLIIPAAQARILGVVGIEMREVERVSGEKRKGGGLCVQHSRQRAGDAQAQMRPT